MKRTKRLGAPRSAVNMIRRSLRRSNHRERRTTEIAQRFSFGGAGAGQAPASEGVQFVTMFALPVFLPLPQKDFIITNCKVFTTTSGLSTRGSQLCIFQKKTAWPSPHRFVSDEIILSVSVLQKMLRLRRHQLQHPVPELHQGLFPDEPAG